MKERLTALLVHGMGNDRSWWDPCLPHLAALDLAPLALEMPSLESDGPEAWVRELTAFRGDRPVVLIGHSLGAGVCLEAALQRAVEGVILLACPPFFPDFVPPVPRGARLSPAAIARVSRFLLRTCAKAGQLSTDAVHIVGDQDVFVPLAQARRYPFPTVVIPAAGHDLQGAPGTWAAVLAHIAASPYGRRYLDPGTRARHCGGGGAPGERLGLDATARSPARLDVEITTRCQSACPHCARTLHRDVLPRAQMDLPAFERLLDGAEAARELFLVGLGEPLLHPEIARFVECSARRGLRTRLVTNGLLADPPTLARLRDQGLSEVTFSLDTTDPARFRRLRGGADLSRVLDHFRRVPAGLRRSVFVTLSQANARDLPGLIDLAAEANLPAIAVTDVNFEANLNVSLHRAACLDALADAIRYARQKNVVLIGPRFHDFAGIPDDLPRCRVRRPSDVAARSPRHAHCLAPWRIAVIGADGALTPCNCAPLSRLGTLTGRALADVWNDTPMQAWRRAVLSGDSPACRACPRY